MKSISSTGPIIDLQSLVASHKPNQVESQLLDIFDTGLNAGAPTDATAEGMAIEIDKRYPKGQGGEGAEDFLWKFWTLYTGIARRVPADDPRQQVLVKIVERLKTKNTDVVSIWDKDEKVWAGLPLLGPCMREAWNARPTLDGTGQDASAVSEWASLNSFAARLHGAGIQSWTNFAIWELRSALEGDVPASTTARDSNLATACEWLAHAGQALYKEARAGQPLDEAEARSLRPGSKLKDGKAGVNEERWRFWRERLSELGPSASEKVQEKAEKVVGMMKEWEEGTE